MRDEKEEIIHVDTGRNEERMECETLSPYATLSIHSKRHVMYPEEQCVYKTCIPA